MKNKKLIIITLLPLLFYPLYFTLANIIDSTLGDQQLISWIRFDSKSLLLKTFFHDWLDSLPIMYGIMIVVFLPVNIILSKYSKYSLLSLMIFSSLPATLIFLFIGFEGYGLIINILFILLAAILLHLSNRVLSIQ